MSQVNGPVALAGAQTSHRSRRTDSSAPFESSHNESFTEDPDFGSSDTSSEEGEHVVNISQQHDSPEVTIVWKDLQVVRRRWFFVTCPQFTQYIYAVYLGRSAFCCSPLTACLQLQSTRVKLAQKRQLLLKNISGYAEPRSV